MRRGDLDQVVGVDAVERGVAMFECDACGDRQPLGLFGFLVFRVGGEEDPRGIERLAEDGLDHVGHAHGAHGRMDEEHEHDHRGHDEEVGEPDRSLGHRVGAAGRPDAGEERERVHERGDEGRRARAW